MTLQDVINQVYRQQVELLEQKQTVLAEIKKVSDVTLRLVLGMSVDDMYKPQFDKLSIEIDTLEKAQKLIEGATEK